MPTLDDVYRKFGEASEAAQLLETELGTLLITTHCLQEGLLEQPDGRRAQTIFDRVNRQTMGQLLKALQCSDESFAALENLLLQALGERNRLSHSFYREHNFRRNSEEGRAEMMRDLEAIHEKLLAAYKAVMRLSGVDLDRIEVESSPTSHVTI